jgi:hypothetical protein
VGNGNEGDFWGLLSKTTELEEGFLGNCVDMLAEGLDYAG